MTEEINFETLQMKIPELVKNYPIELKREIFNYLSEMDEHDKKAYEIALDHLGSSFNIYRSNGFKEWKAKNN
jgi:hypothetical protein